MIINLLLLLNEQTKYCGDYYLNKNFSSSKKFRVKTIYTAPMIDNLFKKILFKIKIPLAKKKINLQILNYLKYSKTDIIFIYKGIYIYPHILKYIKKYYPNIKIITYSGDNMYLWHNKNLNFHFSQKLYDRYITVNDEPYKKISKFFNHDVIYVDQFYDEEIHSYTEKNEYSYEIVFIGSFEKRRLEFLTYLAVHGLKIEIFGGMWKKMNYHENLNVHLKPVMGHDYANLISSSKITISFLRDINFDTQNDRTYEIIACGGFPLLPRTITHQRLYKENIEAIFYDTKEELLEKCRYFLINDMQRNKIKRKGYAKLLKLNRKYSDFIEYIYNLSSNLLSEEL